MAEHYVCTGKTSGEEPFVAASGRETDGAEATKVTKMDGSLYDDGGWTEWVAWKNFLPKGGQTGIKASTLD